MLNKSTCGNYTYNSFMCRAASFNKRSAVKYDREAVNVGHVPTQRHTTPNIIHIVEEFVNIVL
jgi:hypothetical protein